MTSGTHLSNMEEYMGSDRLNKLLLETELLKSVIDQGAAIDLREEAAEELLANKPTLYTLGMLAQCGPEKYREEARARLEKERS